MLPRVRRNRGNSTPLHGQLLLTQRDTGKAINLWETQDDLTLFEASPLYRELMGKLAGVRAGPPTGERYEVGVILVQT